jgi:TonB family protein
MSDFDARFMHDEELRSLLRQWSAPDVPGSLDNRVAATYQQEMKSHATFDSAFHSQRDSEVVAMKFCSTCQEKFADRFSFCPVDGSPLSVIAEAPIAATTNSAAREIETAYPASESAVNQAAAEPEYFEPAITAAPRPVPTTAPPVSPVQPVPPASRIVSPVPVPVPVKAAAVAAAAHAANIGEYHLTILEDAGLLPRLTGELGEVAHNYQLTWPEFKRDPIGFIKRSVQGYGQIAGRFFATRDVVVAAGISLLAMVALIGIIFILDRAQTAGGGVSKKSLFVVGLVAFSGLLALFANSLSRDRGAAIMGAKPSDSRNVLSGIIAAFALLFVVVGGLFIWDRHQMAKAAEQAKDDDLELTQMISDIPNEQPTPDEGTAGMNKGNGGGSKPKQEKAGGGGGGGREEQTPASFGKLPQADLRIPQVVAPDPHPPTIKNPSLPMPATLDADPVLFPPDTRNLSYGDPKSKSTTPSSGSGTGNGIGQGNGGGVGPGDGSGYGPGRGGNTGGGDRNEGGGGPGGGGGGTDYNKIFSGKDVTTKARVLEKPEPTYTEAARKNQITGTVVLRAVFSSNGTITNIHTVSGLSDGLTERAIAAAKSIRFVPATKDGHPVSMWMELQYNFNLY